MTRTEPTKQDFEELEAKVDAGGNVGVEYYMSSNSLTTTSSTTVKTLKHTSRSGKVVVIATGVIKTSIQTSRIYTTCDGALIAEAITNLQSAMTAVCLGVVEVAKDVEKTYAMVLASQSSSATATLFSYDTANLMVFDV